ncbi:MAG: acyl-CoA reductase, partial [Owenweeksia sp.]
HAFLENGFAILKESTDLHAPAAVIYYEYYDGDSQLKQNIETQRDQLQCIVGSPGQALAEVDFGAAQRPHLWDYADKVDILKFLRTV